MTDKTKESNKDGKILYCSFCGKGQNEVRKLIAGPSVFICEECVDLCNNIIDEELSDGSSDQELSLYTNFIVDCLFDANKYFNDQEPWKKKSDIKRLNTIVYVSLEIIRKVSILLNPIIPQTSLKVLEIFNLKQNDILFESIKNHESLNSNDKINKIDILIKKIEKND